MPETTNIEHNGERFYAPNDNLPYGYEEPRYETRGSFF
jgi:hypothetical protein